MDIPPDRSNNYYGPRLNESARRVYDACVEALSKGILKVRVAVADIEEVRPSFHEIVNGILYDHPEIFYIEEDGGGRAVEFSYIDNHVSVTFHDKYHEIAGKNMGCYETKTLSEMLEQIEAELDYIVSKLRKIDSEEERIYRLNQYLCRRVKQGTFGRVDNRIDYTADVYGALILKEARCAGFAKAAKMILDRLGMRSIICDGTARPDPQSSSENHVWNMIYCNGRPYHFDFTWNRGNTQAGIPGLGYMFLADKDIRINHFPGQEYPICDDDSLEFWNKHKCNIEFISDITRALVHETKNGAFAVIRFKKPLSEEDRYENLQNWAINELGGYTYGNNVLWTYYEDLRVASFFFVNM